ncbi:hypothetical protein FEFB_00770 [Fructobacillus sp. EFB-N1]|nr:hypothetical protein FEFB_00770 [Fructobacillus sp. EFB-N1]
MTKSQSGTVVLFYLEKRKLLLVGRPKAGTPPFSARGKGDVTNYQIESCVVGYPGI